MSLSQADIYEAKENIINFLVLNLCNTYKVSSDVALKNLLKTKTYQVLCDTESNLYLETSDYVFDKLNAELNKNWEDWRRL